MNRVAIYLCGMVGGVILVFWLSFLQQSNPPVVQVARINADAAVTITQIQEDGATERTRIISDATKQTNWAFLGLTVWQTATVIWAAAAGLFLLHRKGWI